MLVRLTVPALPEIDDNPRDPALPRGILRAPLRAYIEHPLRHVTLNYARTRSIMSPPRPKKTRSSLGCDALKLLQPIVHDTI